uniref:Uncharacterized protein n=1 Tax=Arundo donax TaxID=35708 RepID=A0A0A9BHW7_ARUDO
MIQVFFLEQSWLLRCKIPIAVASLALFKPCNSWRKIQLLSLAHNLQSLHTSFPMLQMNSKYL